MMNKVSSTKKKILNKDSIGDSALVNHAGAYGKKKIISNVQSGQ